MKPKQFDVELMLAAPGTDVTLTFNRVFGFTQLDAITFAYGMLSEPRAWNIATVKLSDEVQFTKAKLPE